MSDITENAKTLQDVLAYLQQKAKRENKRFCGFLAYGAEGTTVIASLPTKDNDFYNEALFQHLEEMCVQGIISHETIALMAEVLEEELG